ncbi:MAG TPA: nucleotidyltransferase family protein [Streptosporangiaceae bacterium]|jgi:nicotine blue oxidoreductase
MSTPAAPNSPARVAGLLLAAGSGSRLGRPKALVEIAGQTLAERGVALLTAGGAAPVVVVTGAAPVEPAGALVVHNPDWATGMGSSLAAGLTALVGLKTGQDASPNAGHQPIEAVVIALADQPLVGPAAVARLIAAYRDGAPVAVAAYHGQPRNPVLIARPHWAEVIRLSTGDVGARPFLRAHPELRTLVECGDTGRPDDVDTPEDLARIIHELTTSPPEHPAAGQSPAAQ